MKTFGFCHSFYLGLSEKKNTGTKHLNKKQICCNFIYLLWSLEQMASYTCSEEEKQQIIQNKALAILSATWLYWIKNKTATDFNSVCYKKRDNYIQNQTISNKIYFFSYIQSQNTNLYVQGPINNRKAGKLYLCLNNPDSWKIQQILRAITAGKVYKL